MMMKLIKDLRREKCSKVKEKEKIKLKSLKRKNLLKCLVSGYNLKNQTKFPIPTKKYKPIFDNVFSDIFLN